MATTRYSKRLVRAITLNVRVIKIHKMARIYYNKAKGEALLNALPKRDKGICEWRRLAGYENRFLISSNGMVYSLYNYHQMKLETLPNGYVYLPIMLQNPKRHVLTAYIHRLVAMTFIPNPLNKLTVNHKDGNVLNNNVCNLEWATMSEQNYHACRVLGRKRDTSKIAGKPWWECRSLTYAKAAGMPIAFRHGMRAAVILSFGLQCIL